MSCVAKGDGRLARREPGDLWGFSNPDIINQTGTAKMSGC